MARARAAVALLLLLAGLVVAVVTRLDRAGWSHVGRTALDVLVFLVAAKLLADACDAVGLFQVVADRAARAARGSTPLLFGAYLAVAVLTTMLLSLDTTAVLLTPIGLALAHRCRIAARPFAYASVWSANAASLLLPVSNLTNLMVLARMPGGAAGFVGRTALPQAGVLVVLVAAVAMRFARDLRGRHETPSPRPVEHPGLVVVAVVAALVLAVAPLAGVPAWAAAVAGAALLLLAAAVRRHPVARPRTLLRLVPWRMCALVTGLFLLVEVVVERLAPAPVAPGLGGRLALAGAGVAGSWVLTNLAALLALAPMAADPRSLTALLVGVNVGPNVVLWASLANLLWVERCRAAGVRVTAGGFAREGLLVTVPAVLVGALLS